MNKIGVAVIGLGYWGPNLVRNFYKSSKSNVLIGCDLNQELCDKINKEFPSIITTTNFSDVLNNPNIDLVAIATPVASHYKIAKQVLEKGKHVLIEKPITASVNEAESLMAIAKDRGLIIAVDHPFVFSGAFEKTKELIDSQEIGDLLYYDSIRVNLGLFRPDVNVIWDLLPHDLSILDYILNVQPDSVQAIGLDHFSRNNEDMAYVILQYPNNFTAHIHVSWTSPVKIRQTILAGTKKMVIINDLLVDEKMRIYDRGVDQEKQEQVETTFRPLYRSGDVVIPKLNEKEPLFQVCENVIDAINGDGKLRSSGETGLRIMKILEATSNSIKHNNIPIKLNN